MCRYKPDIIKGDLDSIRSEVKDFYAMLVSVINILFINTAFSKVSPF